MCIYSSSNAPEDKYSLVYYIFILLGIGALLPWNAVLTALDFFAINFPSYNPYFVFGLTLNAPNFAFNILTIFVARYLPLKLRFMVSLVIIFAIIFIMPFITEYMEEKLGWILILALIVLMGMASSFFQGGVFGFSGIFPFKYTGAVMFGNGISGLTMNVFRMMCLLIYPPGSDDPDNKSDFYGCLIYFSIAALILILNAIAYLYVVNTDFCSYYMNKSMRKVKPKNEEKEGLLSASNLSDSPNVGLAKSKNSANNDINNSMLTSTTTPQVQEHPHDKALSIMELYPQIAHIALQVFL